MRQTCRLLGRGKLALSAAETDEAGEWQAGLRRGAERGAGTDSEQAGSQARAMTPRSECGLPGSMR